MSDEIEDASMNDVPAKLSEASFAEDWDSKEDRVYDSAETKLLALIKAAMPGPWVVRHRDVGGDAYTDEMSSGLGLEVEGPPEPALRGQYAKSADARLAALAPGLAVAVDLARALRDYEDGELCVCKEGDEDAGCMTCVAQKALARWDEVLAELG